MSKPNPTYLVIWIDHRSAKLTKLRQNSAQDQYRIITVEGPSSYSKGHSPQHAAGRRREALKHYYNQVICSINAIDKILIFGPGSAKHELSKQIQHHKSLKNKVVLVQASSRMQSRELVSNAKKFLKV